MALELNGTTGVSLVQDGVIQTADLVDDAVTAAKIGSLPAGSVLQVVSVNHSTANTTSSTGFTDTGLEASITPSATSSKVLIVTSVHIAADDLNGEHALLQLVANGSGLSVFYGVRDKSTGADAHQSNFSYLHSPNSTSAQTYKIRHRTTNAGSTSRYNYYSSTYGISSNIILMEIAG